MVPGAAKAAISKQVNAACPHSTASAWPGSCPRTGDSHQQVGTWQALLQSGLRPPLSGRACRTPGTQVREGCRDCVCGDVEESPNSRKGVNQFPHAHNLLAGAWPTCLWLAGVCRRQISRPPPTWRADSLPSVASSQKMEQEAQARDHDVGSPAVGAALA